MKQYMTIDLGSSWSKMYGKTGDFFTTVVVNEEGMTSFSYWGRYGVEDRVGGELKRKGYDEKYSYSQSGTFKKREVERFFKSEKEAIEYVKNNY